MEKEAQTHSTILLTYYILYTPPPPCWLQTVLSIGNQMHIGPWCDFKSQTGPRYLQLTHHISKHVSSLPTGKYHLPAETDPPSCNKNIYSSDLASEIILKHFTPIEQRYPGAISPQSIKYWNTTLWNTTSWAHASDRPWYGPMDPRGQKGNCCHQTHPLAPPCQCM